MPETGPVAMIRRPPSGIASRALIAMLTIDVSNWLRSARMCNASSGRISSSSMRDPIRVRTIAATSRTLAPASNSSGVERLATRERQQLTGQQRRAIGRRPDRVEIARPPLIGEAVPLQQVRGSADHRQQVVEIVCDAPGELPDRFELLRLPQLLLDRLALRRPLDHPPFERLVQRAEFLFALAQGAAPPSAAR